MLDIFVNTQSLDLFILSCNNHLLSCYSVPLVCKKMRARHAREQDRYSPLKETFTSAVSVILEKKRVLPEQGYLSLRASQVEEFLEIFFRESDGLSSNPKDK